MIQCLDTTIQLVQQRVVVYQESVDLLIAHIINHLYISVKVSKMQ